MQFVIVVIVVFAIIWFLWDRSNHLFVLRITGGQVEIVGGAPPVRFVQVVRDVVQNPLVMSGSIKGVKAQDGVSLRFSGLSDGQQQQLRNTMKLSPQAALRAGPGPASEKTFWRAIGIAWLLELIFSRWR